MAYRTYQSFQTRKTPQSEAIPGSDQVENSAGGFAWAVDDWKRLDRFLILGSEGGTYYIDQHTLTKENAEAALRCLKLDGPRVVRRVVEVSQVGRAPKNDPAIFVLAMAIGLGDTDTRRLAASVLPQVCRIGTHLFHFAQYAEQFRGWGRILKDAIAAWYTSKSADDLSMQVVKYRQRDGWSHNDLLRLAHPKTSDPTLKAVLGWVTHRDEEGWATYPTDLIVAFEQAQREATSPDTIINLIYDYDLPREALPTELLKKPDVWNALLVKMPMTALIRNLGNMSKVGLLTSGSAAAQGVAERLTDAEALRKARVHPIQILAALITYGSGQGARGGGKWTPVAKVVDALDKAFYLSFGNVEPTNTRIMLALDVSGSMTGGRIAGVTDLSPRIGAAAMALVTANVEPSHMFAAFDTHFREITISPRQRLDDVVKQTAAMRFGATDCALPMLYALEKGLRLDAFVVLTDSETWTGNIHPTQALQRYRERTGISAKLVVVGMTSNGFSIADPNDAGMIDVVGFDTATPQLMSDFIADRI